MRQYELVYVLRPSVAEAGRKKFLETVKSWLKGVTVTKEDDWGQKVLSYPIKKEQSGYFTVLHLESETGVPTDVERRLLTNDDVLRHLLLRTK
jgi:ribosomal protein S6